MVINLNLVIAFDNTENAIDTESRGFTTSGLHSFNLQKKKEIPRDSQCSTKYICVLIFFKFNCYKFRLMKNISGSDSYTCEWLL